MVLANPRLRELLRLPRRRRRAARLGGRAARRRAGRRSPRRRAQAEPIVGDVSTEAARAPRTSSSTPCASPAAGPLLGVVAVFHDVTEIRRLEGMRRDFVANVSHELKTPLTAIRGFAETLRASDVPDGAAPGLPRRDPAPRGAPPAPDRRHPRALAGGGPPAALRAGRGRRRARRRGPAARHAAPVRGAPAPGRGRARARGASPSRTGARSSRSCSNLLDNAMQVHRARRPHRGARRRGRRPGAPRGRGRRHRHPGRRPAAHLRALLPGRQGALARPRRHRASGSRS